jgi:hypothetical protein
MIQSRRTCGGPEPSPARRQDPKLQDTWRTGALPCKEGGSGAIRHMAHGSPPLQGSGDRSHGTRGGAGALPIRKAGFGAIGHVTVLEPTLAGRQGPVLQRTWRCVGARPIPWLDLKLGCRGTRFAGYRHVS